VAGRHELARGRVAVRACGLRRPRPRRLIRSKLRGHSRTLAQARVPSSGCCPLSLRDMVMR
jgi:hypothetical protein